MRLQDLKLDIWDIEDFWRLKTVKDTLARAIATKNWDTYRAIQNDYLQSILEEFESIPGKIQDDFFPERCFSYPPFAEAVADIQNECLQVFGSKPTVHITKMFKNTPNEVWVAVLRQLLVGAITGGK